MPAWRQVSWGRWHVHWQLGPSIPPKPGMQAQVCRVWGTDAAQRTHKHVHSPEWVSSCSQHAALAWERQGKTGRPMHVGLPGGETPCWQILQPAEPAVARGQLWPSHGQGTMLQSSAKGHGASRQVPSGTE
jgi:hypothetical protein